MLESLSTCEQSLSAIFLLIIPAEDLCIKLIDSFASRQEHQKQSRTIYATSSPYLCVAWGSPRWCCEIALLQRSPQETQQSRTCNGNLCRSNINEKILALCVFVLISFNFLNHPGKSRTSSQYITLQYVSHGFLHVFHILANCSHVFRQASYFYFFLQRWP